MPKCQCNDPNHFHPGEELGQWLYPFIDVAKVTCLNEKEDGSAKGIFKPFEQRTEPPKKMLQSDDGQLILKVPFTEMVSERLII